MSKATDPAMYESGFERIEGDRYFTDHWITAILLRIISERHQMVETDVIWEPAAGRGDIARVFLDHGYDLVCSDIDISELDSALYQVIQHDFFAEGPIPDIAGQCSVLISNPPYEKGQAEAFLRKALKGGFDLVALLLRSDFSSAKRRMDLFRRNDFAYEMRITKRPRWDWWFREPQPGEGPRHHFSWFVWDKNWSGPSTQFWEHQDGS